jgi:hypothetical protein
MIIDFMNSFRHVYITPQEDCTPQNAKFRNTTTTTISTEKRLEVKEEEDVYVVSIVGVEGMWRITKPQSPPTPQSSSLSLTSQRRNKKSKVKQRERHHSRKSVDNEENSTSATKNSNEKRNKHHRKNNSSTKKKYNKENNCNPQENVNRQTNESQQALINDTQSQCLSSPSLPQSLPTTGITNTDCSVTVVNGNCGCSSNSEIQQLIEKLVEETNSNFIPEASDEILRFLTFSESSPINSDETPHSFNSFNSPTSEMNMNQNLGSIEMTTTAHHENIPTTNATVNATCINSNNFVLNELTEPINNNLITDFSFENLPFHEVEQLDTPFLEFTIPSESQMFSVC